MEYPIEFRYLKLVLFLHDVKSYIGKRIEPFANNFMITDDHKISIALYTEICFAAQDLDINDVNNVIETEQKILNLLVEHKLYNLVRDYRLSLLNF